MPGLQTLSIISSPDLTDEGLAAYLSTTLSDFNKPNDETTVYHGQYTLGHSLLSLTLANTPRITIRSLIALESHCHHLVYLDLRNTDRFFEESTSQSQPAEAEESPSPKEIFHHFIENNTALHTFTFSSGLSSLPLDLFSAFNKPQGALQNLSIYSSKAIKPQHLTYFPSIYRLTVSGCLGLGDDLPFECMPKLQEVSFLGRGLSLSSLWKLFQYESIRKMTLDVAGSAYETCICSESTSSNDTNSSNSDQATPQIHVEFSERVPFPTQLKKFKNHNILSSTIPSWVVTFFLASSPTSLESISLHGVIVPTCCSIRSSLPLPSLTDAIPSTTFSDQGYPFTYRSMLRPSILSIPLIRTVLSIVPRVSLKALLDFYQNGSFTCISDAPSIVEERDVHTANDPATAAAAALSFQSLRALVAGQSARCPSSELEEELSNGNRETFPIDAHAEANEAGNSDLLASDARPHVDDNSTSEEETIEQIDLKRRLHRAQSISGVPSRKAKVARRALQRSTSEFDIGRDNKVKSCTGKEMRNLTKQSKTCSPRSPEATNGLSGDMLLAGLPNVPRTSEKAEAPPIVSAQEAADAKQAALVRLLAISSTKDSTSASTSSHSPNVGTSRLSPQQVEWLHSATQGRIVRLEL